MDNGWISVHRTMLNWEWFEDSTTFHIFMYCLLRANHAPNNWQGNKILRGQFITSIGHISEDTGHSIQRVRTSLKRLKSTNEITIKTSNKYSIISITNYTEYQEANKPTNKQLTNKQQTTNKQLTTNNNDNKENNDNNGNKDQKKAKPAISKKEYPKELNSKAWLEYIKYRKESKIRKLTSVGEDKQIKKLIGFGDYGTQAACINETISNGWQGIFELKKPKKQTRGNHDGFNERDYQSGAVTPDWANDKN